MEYMSDDELPAQSTGTAAKILCCQCGTLIEPNQSNMCVGCLRAKVDITEGIPKQAVVYFCKTCERYQQDQGKWIKAELESNELLALCLKKLKGLTKVDLIDASFVWTEPHSRRVKLKLTIQKEVSGGDVLRQVFVVEFVVQTQMCDLCHRVEAKDFWKAKVQVRQRAERKKTILYLEQLLFKSIGQFAWTKTKALGEGLDFYFDKVDDARKLIEFIQKSVPCRYSASQQLISHDCHSNVYNYKYTFVVEIVPICKDDIVCLPVATSRALGNIGRLCVCTRVTHNIYLINPTTLRSSEMNAAIYYRAPFTPITVNLKKLTEYMVMNLETTDKILIDKSAVPEGDDVSVASGKSTTPSITSGTPSQIISGSGSGAIRAGGVTNGKYLLADVWVVRSSELGITDHQIHCKTHLGNLLHPGDTALGFDLANANLNNAEYEDYKSDQGDRMPDVILLKKSYGDI